jgi:hypothetical protein
MTGVELLQRISAGKSNGRKPILSEHERYYLYQSDEKPFQPLLKKLPRKYYLATFMHLNLK